MGETKVTVAIPTYNRSQLLKISLKSVLAQDYPDFRVVVLDNASSDDTGVAVKSFADPRVTYVRNETNIGMVSNLNRAIQVNSSPYLSIFLDDDVMLPGFLRESAQFLDEHPHVAFSLTLARYIDANGLPMHLADVDLPTGLIDGLQYLHLSAGKRRTGSLSTVLMRASALAVVGPFDSPHTKHTTDLNMFLRLARHFDVGFIRDELVQVRLHSGQASELQWGRGRLGYTAEYIDAVAHLLQSSRAQDSSYREWLAERLLVLNARQSEALYELVPDLYWTLRERLDMATREIAALIPPGETLILVDAGEWGSEVVTGRHAIPFLERDGQYWGPPPDDDTAIREFERLRQSGASFMVFGWPAFWWLDYYGGLRDYLNSKFACIQRNSRLVAFDLRLCLGSCLPGDTASRTLEPLDKVGGYLN